MNKKNKTNLYIQWDCDSTDIRYNFANPNDNRSTIINLDNIDKKLSNNQLNWVLAYTWQNAVT